MDTSGLERRTLLQGAGVAGASLIGLSQMPAADEFLSTGSGSSVLGAWDAHGDRFSAHFWTATPAEGKQPAVVIEARVRGSVQGENISGTFRVTVYAAKNQKVLQRGRGTFSGHRING